MSQEGIDKDGLSRRNFMKTVGLAGVGAAVASTGVISTARAAGEPGQGIPKRKLGKTGVEVSALCLGGMFDTLNNQLLLKQAFNWGVTYWDTAEGYGGGMSEDGYGRFFSRNPGARKEIFLATKNQPDKNTDLSSKVDAALKRLNTDYLDLYFLHGISKTDVLDARMKEAAAKIKQSGKVKFFGFTTHSNMEDCLLEASKLDWIDVIMFTYNFRLMHEAKMKTAFDACVKSNIGLVAMKSQGGGSVKVDSETELKLAGRFLEKGFTDKQAKLKAVWENPHIASICSQMPTLTILSANVAAARDQTKLAGTDKNLFTRYAEETRHGYCAGCANICSEAVAGLVPVNDVMRYMMYYNDYGDRDLAREYYAALPSEVRARLAEIDYSAAEKSCPQGLAIADLMRSAATLLA